LIFNIYNFNLPNDAVPYRDALIFTIIAPQFSFDYLSAVLFPVNDLSFAEDPLLRQ